MTGVQKAVISALLNDEGTQTALGFTSPNKGAVMESQGFRIDGMRFPSVTVELTTESYRQVQQSALMGGKISDSYVSVHIFSKLTTSAEAEAIEAAIQVALDGSKLSSDTLACYSCDVDSTIQRARDDDTALWHLIVRYHLIVRPQ